jgi:hypothetical protein
MREDEDVDPGETILRRIPSEHFDASLPNPVSPNAFRPSGDDIDGISLYREAFVSPLQVARKARRPASTYVVARLQARDVMALGLTIVPTPGNLPGHVSLPEINTASYNDKTSKSRVKDLNLSLAKLVGKDVVVGFTDA